MDETVTGGKYLMYHSRAHDLDKPFKYLKL
jgi:hypothetical protein